MKKSLQIITAALLMSALLTGCTTRINVSLINSRSPQINPCGTNDVDAATGFEGGGTLTSEATLPAE